MTVDIALKFDDTGRGAFFLEKDGDRLAEMAVAIQNKNLIVYHTEVAEKLKGQGIGTALLSRMVAYVRENKLKVVPLCPYVLAQFKRHPDEYADVWNKNWHN
jgi:predicted GNAT family acetyltransferase